MGFLLFVAIFGFVWAAIVSTVAGSKGYNGLSWGLYGFIFGPLALIMIACMGNRNVQVVYINHNSRTEPDGLAIPQNRRSAGSQPISQPTGQSEWNSSNWNRKFYPEAREPIPGKSLGELIGEAENRGGTSF
jgi:hypothetical protein